MTVVIVVVVNFVEIMIIFKMTAMVTVGVRIVADFFDASTLCCKYICIVLSTHSYKYVAFQVYCVVSTNNCCKYVMYMFM